MSESTNTRQLSCNERIESHAESRAGDFYALTELAGVSSVSELLELTENSTVRALLSEMQPASISAELLDLITADPETAGDEHSERLEEMADEQLSDRDLDDIREDAQQRIYEMPLSVERKTVFRIDLSTGGPADWLEVRCSTEDGESFEIDGVTYVFQDWFDGARRELQGFALEAAENFARALIPELS